MDRELSLQNKSFLLAARQGRVETLTASFITAAGHHLVSRTTRVCLSLKHQFLLFIFHFLTPEAVQICSRQSSFPIEQSSSPLTIWNLETYNTQVLRPFRQCDAPKGVCLYKATSHSFSIFFFSVLKTGTDAAQADLTLLYIPHLALSS